MDASTLSVADVTVVDAQQQAFSPTSLTALSDKRFQATFASPLGEGRYTLTVGPDVVAQNGLPMDQNRNGTGGEIEDAYTFAFVVDLSNPAAVSVDVPVAPVVNKATSTAYVLSGNREAETAILVNGNQVVPQGSGPWSATLTLPQGRSSLRVEARDAAGNLSAAVEILVDVDSIRPVINTVAPSNGTITATPPTAITLTFTETGSGLNLAGSSLAVTRASTPISGSVTQTGNQLTFTPAIPFLEGSYTVQPTLVDNHGNLANPATYTFVVDYTPPPAPVLNDYPAVTSINTQTFSGTKEAGSRIVRNGQQVVGATSSTSWSYAQPLAFGDNTFSFTARDAAGNESPAVEATIRYDDQAPGPVSITVNPNGSGTELTLSWSGYNEVANGNDIATYRVYAATQGYTSIAGLTPVREIAAGTKSATITGLTRATAYYVSVVAVDRQGLLISEVTPVVATPVDTQAPAEITQLQVISGPDSIGLSWLPSANSDGDLAAYRLRYTAAGETRTVTLNQADIGTTSPITYTLTGLAPATAHNVAVAAVDSTGNASTGLSNPAVTWLPNPTNLQAEGFSGRAELSWSAVSPHTLLKHYAVYVQPASFTSVAGLTPTLILPKGSASQTTVQGAVAGLTDGETVYVAVTAVNVSSGESPTVTPVSVTPQADTEGPVISAVTFTGNGTTTDLTASPTLTHSGVVAVTASDKSALSRVVLTLDGQPLANLTNGAGGSYTYALDLARYADGGHALGVAVYDTLDNVTEADYPFTLALAAPATPVITTPVASQLTNQPRLTVSGTTSPNTRVQLLNNGVVVADNLVPDSQQRFSTTLTLAEGENALVAQARYTDRTAWSDTSASRVITLNTEIPDAPTGVTATAAQQGQVYLSWNAVASSSGATPVKGYRVYRASTPFTSTTEAGVQLVNTSLLTATTYTDLVVADGAYVYAVTAVNQANNESALSARVSATVDSTGPKALSVTYTSSGPVDSASGRMAPGIVQLVVQFDEPLRNKPYFALVPNGGVPIPVELTKDYNDDQRYSGQLAITEATPSGQAYVVMSAHDQAGNRGTEVLDGARLLIDTDGPEATALALNPTDPLKVDAVNGLSVDVALTLNDELPGNEQPVLIPLLDGEALAGYEAGLSLARDSQSPAGSPLWLGTLVLPVSAGQDENGQPTVATLSFRYRARDDLNNLATRIQGPSSFQVYQGDLPPLNVPLNLTARARANGQVALSWDAVNAAAGYVVYRQGPMDTELVALDMPDLLTTPAYTDTTPVDGTYVYAVTSVRRENQQEAESARSDSVSVQTDRVAPGAPQDLDLELNGAGLVARWTAPTQDASGNPQTPQGLTYNLYRLDRPEGQQITDLTGLTPLQTGIPALIALDTTPSETEHSYLVTAVDAAGNESAPSTTEYLNFGLLPVSHLTLVLSHQGFPQLSWRHNGQAISHYRVYRHQGEEEPVLIADDVPHAGATTTYTDTGYNQAQASDGAGTAVVYSVVAVDDNAVESLGHDLPLPALLATLADADVPLARGVMNRVLFRVDNRGDERISGVRLVVNLRVNGVLKEHASEVFAVEAGAFTPVPVVIGGYADLDGLADLQLRLDYTPQANDRVTIHQAVTVPVTSASLLADLATEDFVRGGSGKASFTLENTSAVETEIVMASSNGNAASPEVRLVLEDLQGNVLSVQPVKQYSGGVVTLSNGRTVARLAPGETFTSAPVEIPVPEAAPDQVRLRLVIDRFHYQLGRDTQVAIEGVGARRELMLSETPYTAELTAVTPAVLYGPNDEVTLAGRALDRASGQPLAQVPVSLVLTVRGFETRVTVYTDAEGSFSHVYAPQGTSGTYRVSVLHPDVRERPTHGEFRVEGGSVTPSELRVNIPRNYTQTIPLRVNAGYDSELGNVRLTLLGQDTNSTPQLPLGINVSHDPVTAIKARATGYLNLRFNGDNSADATGSLRYRVEADNFTGARALGEVTLHYTLSEAKPAVSASPTYIETGVGLGEQVVENLTVTNKGLETLHNAQVSLVMRTGNDPVPSWVRLGTAPALGNLAVGESRPVQVIASPPTGVTEDDYEFALRITGDNLATPFTIPVFIAVTQSGQGKVLFRVADIYTSTLDENHQLIPGLAGARIRLQNENVLTQTFDLITDADGEILSNDLPAGRYAYRASAFDHSSVSGRVWIKPGVTATEDVFLMNSLVTVEWSVREITIEDRYEIRLDATFETHVPVALVMFSPLNVQLPVMKQGDLFHGELTLTNHGLIRATNVQSQLPQGNDLARIEFLREIPATLEAGEVFTLPYRIQALRDFNPAADANATGGGCGSFNAQARVNYQSQCANGTVVPGGTSANWNSNWGKCTSGGGGGSGGGGSSYYYGGGSGGGSSYVPRGGALGDSAPNQCAAPPYCEECNKDNGAGG